MVTKSVFNIIGAAFTSAAMALAMYKRSREKWREMHVQHRRYPSPFDSIRTDTAPLAGIQAILRSHFPLPMGKDKV